MLYIIEVPHQHRASCWSCQGREEFVDIVLNNTDDYYRIEWDAEAAALNWGDDKSEWDQRVRECLETHAQCVEVSRGGEVEVLPVEAAPSAFDLALDALSHDLSGCHVLTTEEAREYVNGQRVFGPHQGIRALIELKREMVSNEEVSSDE